MRHMDPVQLYGRVGDVALGITGGATVVGATTIGNVNEYLQAGAFIVAMISGTAGAIYHLTAWWKARKR